MTFEDWQKLDQIEVENGKKLGKPREKIVSREDALKLIKKTYS